MLNSHQQLGKQLSLSLMQGTADVVTFLILMCQIVSVEIYGRMSTDLLPTPTKSHYIFNLRDLSKCIQGSEMIIVGLEA